ncbi:MAG TPA: GNAT family N-acetyltransferase [Thermoanaerobaculia bacterium]
MELRTTRLLLRDFVEQDAERLAAYGSEAAPLVPMFIGWAAEVPRTRWQLAMVLDGSVIGTCGVRQDEADPAVLELGCELDPAYWGRGYAREACSVLLALAPAEKRIVARTTADNAAALRLARDLGVAVMVESTEER